MNAKMKIMAPAGSPESMNAAIRAGADEVYMGISGFGARRFAQNFSVEEFCHAVDFAHKHGVQVNITLNTIMSAAELEDLEPTLDRLYVSGVDAVIIQDLGFARLLQQRFPDWARHASTQLSIATPQEARWAEEMGFARLVLARELSFEEIGAIRQNTTVELEVFASGALCIAASGKCYLSSFIGGRSGNRGSCTQPCRQWYEILDPPTASFENGGFFLSSCDQWQEAPEIARLAKIGVDVIKLEGRMKSPEYVFEATRYYRRLIDSLDTSSADSTFLETSRQKSPGPSAPRPPVAPLFNRGYAKGYLYESDPDFINSKFSSSWGVEVGRVQKGKIRLSAPVRHGDGIVFLDANLQKLDGGNVSKIFLMPQNKPTAEAPQGAVVRFGQTTPPDAVFVYKTFDIELNRQIESARKNARRRTPLHAEVVARVGQPLEITLSFKNVQSRVRSAESLAASQKRTMDAEAIFEAFDRFGETPFGVARGRTTIDTDDRAFVPRSLLNDLRQNACARLEDAIVSSYRRAQTNMSPAKLPSEFSTGASLEPSARSVPDLAAAVWTEEQREVCVEFGIKRVYRLRPPVCFDPVESAFRYEFPTEFAPLAGSLNDAIRLSETGAHFALDWMMNVGNPFAIEFYQTAFPRAHTLYLSPELGEKTLRALISSSAWVGAKPGVVIYGHLYGMFTRKTIFRDDIVRLRNQDGRNLFVTRNSAHNSTVGATGSRVFLATPQDIVSAFPLDSPSPPLELRLDFTIETPEQVRRILEKYQRERRILPETNSYGYHRGIF